MRKRSDEFIAFDEFDELSVSGSELAKRVTAEVLGSAITSSDAVQTPHPETRGARAGSENCDSARPVAQQTLKTRISCVGTGLNCSSTVSLTLTPADPNTGIVFVRTDVRGRNADVTATWHNATSAPARSVVANPEGVEVSTISHLMAALYGCGIDNARIELDGPEVPIVDGSADAFVFLIECAGILQQDIPRRAIRILRSIAVEDGKRLATLGPVGEPVLSLETEHESARERRYLSFRLAQNAFKQELSRARSFRFLHRVEETEKLDSTRGRLRSAGVVVSGHPAWAEGRPRYSDEFARHKMLDTIGDLALAGAYIIGHFQGVDSDHSLNAKLIRSLFEQSDAWEWIELPIGGAPDRGYEGEERTFAA